MKDWCDLSIPYDFNDLDMSVRPRLSEVTARRIYNELYGPGGIFSPICDCQNPDCTGGLIVDD